MAQQKISINYFFPVIFLLILTFCHQYLAVVSSCHKEGYKLEENGNWYMSPKLKQNFCTASVACNRDGARLAMFKTEEDIKIFGRVNSK